MRKPDQTWYDYLYYEIYQLPFLYFHKSIMIQKILGVINYNYIKYQA